MHAINRQDMFDHLLVLSFKRGWAIPMVLAIAHSRKLPNHFRKVFDWLTNALPCQYVLYYAQ